MWDYAYRDWFDELTPRTQEAYKDAWANLRAHCPHPYHQIQQQDIKDWRDTLLKRGYAKRSIRMYLGGVSSFYRYLNERTITDHNPCVGVKRPPIPKPNPRWMTLTESRKFLAAIDRTTPMGRRDYALLKLMLLTGLRSAEARNIRYADLIPSTDDRTALRYTPKGERSPITRTLPRSVCDAIQLWITDRTLTASSPIFISLSRNSNPTKPLTSSGLAKIVEHYSLRALDRILNPHALRHAYAEMLYKMTNDVRKVQRGLRHKHIATTLLYLAHMTDDGVADEDKLARHLDTTTGRRTKGRPAIRRP